MPDFTTQLFLINLFFMKCCQGNINKIKLLLTTLSVGNGSPRKVYSTLKDKGCIRKGILEIASG